MVCLFKLKNGQSGSRLGVNPGPQMHTLRVALSLCSALTAIIHQWLSAFDVFNRLRLVFVVEIGDMVLFLLLPWLIAYTRRRGRRMRIYRPRCFGGGHGMLTAVRRQPVAMRAGGQWVLLEFHGKNVNTRRKWRSTLESVTSRERGSK